MLSTSLSIVPVAAEVTAVGVVVVGDPEAERDAADRREKKRKDRDCYLQQLVDSHREEYERTEKRLFDKARRYYQGKFWGAILEDGGALDSGIGSSMLASKNMVYAITDTALSAMLGNNPQVACDPRNAQSEKARYAVDGLLKYVFDQVKIRRRASQALMNAVLTKRGIFKTTWSRVEDRPKVTVVDPSRLFFDLRATDVDDIRYWVEATVISKREFNKRVQSGLYKHKDIDKVVATRWPAWMESSDEATGRDVLRNVHQWIEVYEHYDRENNVFEHYIPGTGVVYRCTLPYIPYSMFTLSPSGVDCRGLSEIQLVLSQQEAINDLLTLVKQVAYLMIPRMMYDSSAIDPNELGAALSSDPGAFVPINPSNSLARRNLGAFFEQMPMPATPQPILDLISRFEDDAAHITALAEMSRGQVVGARTATEMALIDAQMRNRLATREGHLAAAIEDVAAKCIWLCGKYMKDAKAVRVSGEPSWASVDCRSLRDIAMDYRLVAYSPLKNNPSVMAETLQNIMPMLAQDPDIRSRELKSEFLRLLGLPVSRLVKTQEEVDAETQAAMEAQGAGPGPGPGPGAPADIQQLMALAQEEGTVPPPEGAIAAPGAQADADMAVQDLAMDPEMIAQIFNMA